MMDNFFKAMKDSDWGESVTDLDFNRNTSELLNDCERAVRREPELELAKHLRDEWDKAYDKCNGDTRDIEVWGR